MRASSTATEAGLVPPDWSRAGFKWSAVVLVAVSWLSAALFGSYVLAFYLGVAPGGPLDAWNKNLPRLYEPGHPAALISIAAHFATGAILLLLGPIQLIAGVRRRWPGLHRWTGRLYVLAAAVAGLGGLGFIIAKGTVGGGPMDLGFGLYGALVTFAAMETYRLARAGRFEAHRAWAIRLYALAIGSWLYRMEYGFWLMIGGGAGHTRDFRGPFDVIMAFFFYLPNLLVAEFFIRGRRAPAHSATRAAGAAVLNLASSFVGLATYYFGRYYWGPAILQFVTGNHL